MDAHRYEGIARWTYDRFLLLQPHVPVEGLFFDGASFVVVCPTLRTEVTTEGRPLQEWFNCACRPAAMPIRIADRRTDNAEFVRARTPTDTVDGVGEPRRVVDVFRDLGQALPASFPLLGIDDNPPNVYVLVARSLTKDESEDLDRSCERLGLWFDTTVQVRPDACGPLPPSDLELPAVRALPSTVPRVVRHLLDQDEQYWAANRRELLTAVKPSEQLLASPWADIRGAACVVATTLPPQNIRSYLSVYSNVVLVAPLGDELDQTLDALGIKRKDLTELVARGCVRVLFPQAISRYQIPWVEELAEAGPANLLFSRRLATLTVADQRRRLPFLVPGDAFERRAALRALRRATEAADHPANAILGALYSGLARYWADAESFLNSRGAMASVTDGLVMVASALVQTLYNKDAFLELGAAAQPLQWAGALGAHYSPAESDSYSEIGAARLLAALHSGIPRNMTPLAHPREFQVIDDLLVLDNDVSVFDLVEEGRSGDMARLQQFARTLVQKNSSKEELADFIERWNAQVRHYEKAEDRLKRFALGGIGIGMPPQR